MPAASILVVEDDPDIAEYVRIGLSRAGYKVTSVRDGASAKHRLMTESFQVVVLDRMLPVMDGLTLLDLMRATGNQTAVIILSALASVDERVRGLGHGADDYLTKPFHISELLARIAALERRLTEDRPPRPTKMHFRDVSIDVIAREVTKSGTPTYLSGREFALLQAMMEEIGNIVSRATLLKLIWNYDFDPGTNLIDVHISRLRTKIENPKDGPIITTVRGKGYGIGLKQFNG